MHFPWWLWLWPELLPWWCCAVLVLSVHCRQLARGSTPLNLKLGKRKRENLLGSMHSFLESGVQRLISVSLCHLIYWSCSLFSLLLHYWPSLTRPALVFLWIGGTVPLHTSLLCLPLQNTIFRKAGKTYLTKRFFAWILVWQFDSLSDNSDNAVKKKTTKQVAASYFCHKVELWNWKNLIMFPY